VSIRTLAESDLSFTLEDSSGFGWPISITDPAGNSNVNPLFGQSGDIGQAIDPDTGEAVTGRFVHVSLRLSTLRAEFSGKIPSGINDENKKPWLVSFDDINGKSYNFKVIESAPDRTLGFVSLLIGAYRV